LCCVGRHAFGLILLKNKFDKEQRFSEECTKPVLGKLHADVTDYKYGYTLRSEIGLHRQTDKKVKLNQSELARAAAEQFACFVM
jgi:hypothetical protein